MGETCSKNISRDGRKENNRKRELGEIFGIKEERENTLITTKLEGSGSN